MAGAEGVAAEGRFAFGANWRDFSREIGPEQVAAAREGIARLCGAEDLAGRSFLDIGSGSGLMSLAAHQMGASVVAFDYDADSVATTASVRDAFAGEGAYPVRRGSVLDPAFMAELGEFDIVYSWGVLHHTGDLWRACELAAAAVAPGGVLAIAIYNDQGAASRGWTRVKRAYVTGGPLRRRALVAAAGAYFQLRSLAARVVVGAPSQPRPRGMDRRHDLVDWVGGYPFEVTSPEAVFEFFRQRAFTLEALSTCGGGLGCNEFAFRRSDQV